MMKIIFFPQNKSQLDNMKPLASSLNCGGNIYFLDASHYIGQNLYDQNFEYETIVVKGVQPKAEFYRLSSLKKIKKIREFKKKLMSVRLLDFEAVIVSNDGALQRLVLKKSINAKKYLVLDGIISNYSFRIIDVFKYSDDLFFDLKDFFRRKLRDFLARYIYLLPLSEFFPSEIGSYKFDAAFVLSQHVKSVLQSRGSPIKEVYTYGLPRYAAFLDPHPSMRKKNPFRILIITQGYLWHNEVKNDEYQHKEIAKICSVVQCLKESGMDIELVIRVHPRDEWGRYLDYHYSLEGMEADLEKSIAKSHMVLGFNSTVILESLCSGTLAYSVMTCGQRWRFRESFLSSDLLPKINNIEDLSLIIREKYRDWPEKIYPESIIRDLFNPISQTTVYDIVKTIKNG